MIVPAPLSEALANQRRHLRQTYALATGILLLLVVYGGYCMLVPWHTGLSTFARIGTLVLLVVCLLINISTIRNTKRFLRQFNG